MKRYVLQIKNEFDDVVKSYLVRENNVEGMIPVLVREIVKNHWGFEFIVVNKEKWDEEKVNTRVISMFTGLE